MTSSNTNKSRGWPAVVCVSLLVALTAHVAAAQVPGPEGAAPPTQTTKGEGPLRDGTYRVGGDVKPPKATYSPDPAYPEEARRAKYQAWVVLWLVVDAEGSPRQIRVQQTAGMGLDEQAIESVKQWRFEPATKNGQPVPVRVNVEVNFRLYDKQGGSAVAPSGASPLLYAHPASSAKPPQFPGVDTAKYPLLVTVLSAVGSPSAKSYVIGAKATIDGAGLPQSASLSCSGEKKHCSYLGNGRYPARWLDANERLEILGLGRDDRKWEKTEYVINQIGPLPTL
jgi:TonB family protein